MPKSGQHCTPPGQPPGTMRPSRRAPWRALSLILVHVVFAIHILHWYYAGTTLTPVEPSEAMQTLGSRALVNAGFVFFLLAIASTLVVGRFFCGWGCHIIALQDLCTWLLRKLRIRPRPLRSRLLVYVPLLAAIYMFVVPTLTRIWLGQPRDSFQAHFLTDDFWSRFPGPVIATLTFLVCGFIIVYLLGNKGFCTYACPYGGVFGPADMLAPGKIRVTDACDGCGHCTASCTSNVRVHEEVKLHRMVVDPGCMKCTDCVSVCPLNALYFGFGKPTIARGEARAKAPRRRHDFTWSEELGMAAVFMVAIVILRGLYDVIPFLLALGLAATTAFMSLTAYRFLRRQSAQAGNAALHSDGRVTRAGVVFAIVMLVWGAFLVQAGALKAMAFTGERRVKAATVGRAAPDQALLADGIRLLKTSARLAPVAMPRWDGTLAEALTLANRHDEAERHFRRAVDHAPRYVAAWHALARYAIAREDHAAAIEALEHMVEIPPTDRDAGVWLELASQHEAVENDSLALQAASRAVELNSDLLGAHVIGAETALRLQLPDEAGPFVTAARRKDPENQQIIALWAQHLAQNGELEPAIARAERDAATSRQAKVELAYLYQAAGRYPDAVRVARELAGESGEHHGH